MCLLWAAVFLIPKSVPVLMLFYSIAVGTGLGLMYVPAVVAVGYCTLCTAVMN